MKKTLSLALASTLLFYTTLPSFAQVNKPNKFVEITRNKNHLHSRLSKRYSGYIYEVKNISQSPLKIEAISIKDNISGKSAYLSVKRTSIGASVSTLAVGTAFALPTLSLSLILSAVAVPFIVAGNAIGNTGARQEAKRYEYEALNTEELAPLETVSFKTLAPHKEAPDVDVIFINPKTQAVEVYCYK